MFYNKKIIIIITIIYYHDIHSYPDRRKQTLITKPMKRLDRLGSCFLGFLDSILKVTSSLRVPDGMGDRLYSAQLMCSVWV